MKLGLLAATASAAVLLAGAPASAAVFFTFTPGGSSPVSGLTIFEDFESGAGGVSGSGFAIKDPPSDSSGAIIPNSTFPGDKYLSVLANGIATIDFGPQRVTKFSFDWGSLDNYNKLHIVLKGGGSFDVVPGVTPIINTPANGNQFLPGTNGVFLAYGDAGEDFASITLTSTQNSFEIDNVAVGVPEPATWAMMLMGFGGLGAMLRSRRQQARTAIA